jgi:predicted SAM-dependent methyltransferase
MGKIGFTTTLVKLGLLDKSYDLKWPNISLVNLNHELPDEDESVDFIYCSHVLEHFERQKTVNILRECRRVLKDKGAIRIVLPDLSKLIKDYSDADKFNREYFGFDKDLYVGWMGIIKRMFIRGHQWMYDKKSAKELLIESGFKKIKLFSFRKGEVPNLDKLDLKMHQKLSMYYEAKKQ